jgi:hypothetical protein
MNHENICSRGHERLLKRRTKLTGNFSTEFITPTGDNFTRRLDLVVAANGATRTQEASPAEI